MKLGVNNHIEVGTKLQSIQDTLETSGEDETTYIITEDDMSWTAQTYNNNRGTSLDTIPEMIIAHFIQRFNGSQQAILRQRAALGIGGGGG